MADNSTKLEINIETILRGLDKTLRGLAQVEKSLKAVSSVKISQQAAANTRAATSAQRLANQQQRLSIQSQELANRQERARQSTERLRLSQDRLTAAQQRAARASLGPALDAHVQVLRRAEAATRDFNRRLAGLGNSLHSIGQGLSTVGLTLTGAVTVPLVSFGTAVVNAAVQLDSLKRGLTAITGSSAEANRQLARLTEIAKLPGIGFQEAIQGSIRLQAVGFSAQEAEKALRQFSNAIALTGGGRDELNRVTVQLGQLAAKGKVLSQDLRPIIESAPAVGRALLQAFGTVNADDIQELGLSSKEFLSILVDQLERLPRAAAGAKNSFENFQDELFRAAATVGDALLPALTRLVEVVGPIISELANAFSKLPTVLQVIVVGLGLLLAGFGPVLFIVGQLTTGVGRLLVGFAQLNAIGILPTIRNLRAMVAGTLSAAQAQRTLAATTAAVAGGLGIIVGVIALVATAYGIYSAFQQDSVKLGKEQVDALEDQINGLKSQASFLDKLQTGVERTADEQNRLLEIYDQLNVTAQARITGIGDEEERLAALREELGKIIALREEERRQQAAKLAGEIANSLQTVAANEREIESITDRIRFNNALADSIQATGKVTRETSISLARRGITATTVEEAVGGLQAESESLVETQTELRKNTVELNGSAREQVQILQGLQRQTGLTGRELLTSAKSMGVFRGNVEETLKLLERFTADTEEATRAVDLFSRTLRQQSSDLLKAGDAADDLAKKRKALIDAAGSLAREASDSFEGALKFLNAFIAAQPELRRAIERESQIQGKTFSEVVEKVLEDAFKGRAKSGTSLRNAQEELAKALAQVALASSEEQVRIEKEKNEQLLQTADTAQKLQLISYREFLETKAALTAASIEKEIIQQADVVKAAKDAQLRLIREAGRTGIPEAERTRRRAQAAKADEEAIKAQSKLNTLTEKRDQLQVELQQSLKLAQHEQISDIRQLDIEFAQLQGRIEDALNAATVEKFREKLTDLSLAQARLNKQLESARKERNADRVTELTEAQRLNQNQIDVIELLIQQERANNNLAAAEELVRRARERQADLESRLSLEVENRGLKEEDAIRQRLEGEQKLIASLELARNVVKDTIADLHAKGVQPPQALVEFVRDITASLRGLGELSFSEQFRLAQKEFDRLNDERIRKIEDVERAIRNRTIAEVEGAILIRRINGQYTADLETQLQLLKQIADASNQPELRRQAEDAGEVVKDTKDRFADLGTQIEATGKDAFRSGFAQFLKDMARDADNAKEHVLAFLDSIISAINDTIAEHLSQELFESLFGGPDNRGGVIAGIKRLFGGGASSVEAVAHGAEGAAHAAESAAASTALVTGATTAAATLATGATAAAASFTAAVVAAGATFAASVAAAAGVQTAGGLGSAFGGGFATGDIIPARPGGILANIAEAGHAEAVLTTDPKHAAKQARILSRFLRLTRGLQGRFPVPELASGAMIDPRHTEAQLLSGITRAPLTTSSLANLPLAAAGGGEVRLRQVLVDERNVGDWMNSSEGERVFRDKLIRNAPVIRRLGGRK